MEPKKIVHAMHAMDKTKHDGAPCGEKGTRRFSPDWSGVTCEGCLRTLTRSKPSAAFATFARIGKALDGLTASEPERA